MSQAPRNPDDLGAIEYEPADGREAAPVAGVVLGFVGIVMMIFGLPMAVMLPAGLIWGKNSDTQTILSLIGVTVVGAIFVYAASLLIGAAVKSFRGK